MPRMAGGCGPRGGVTQAILTCSPYFIDLALNEMRRHHCDITVLQHLAPGYVFLETHAPFEELTRPWRDRLPIYLHHLFPVQTAVSLDTPGSDLTRLKMAVRRLAPPDAIIQFRSTLQPEAFGSLAKIQSLLNKRQPGYHLDPPAG